MHRQPEFTRLVFNDIITKSDPFPALALLPVKTIYISCQMDERFKLKLSIRTSCQVKRCYTAP